jgi:hypothetical protein
MASGTTERRGPLLTGLAVAMGLLSFSNFWKPVGQHFAPETSVGFVLLGHRLHGAPNAVAGLVFGALLAAYAVGVWTRKRWVVPIAIGYAVYVVVNLVAFSVTEPESAVLGFFLVYCPIAIGVSAGGAAVLWRMRERLA